MCHRPSVISAAATLFVLDQELTKDALHLKIGCLTPPHSFNSVSAKNLMMNYQYLFRGINGIYNLAG